MKNGDKAVYDGKIVEVVGFDNKNNLTKIKYENKSTLLVPTELLYLDHRLSDNPAVALWALMKKHDITFEFGRESNFSWGQVGIKDGRPIARETAEYNRII